VKEGRDKTGGVPGPLLQVPQAEMGGVGKSKKSEEYGVTGKIKKKKHKKKKKPPHRLFPERNLREPGPLSELADRKSD